MFQKVTCSNFIYCLPIFRFKQTIGAARQKSTKREPAATSSSGSPVHSNFTCFQETLAPLFQIRCLCFLCRFLLLILFRFDPEDNNSYVTCLEETQLVLLSVKKTKTIISEVFIFRKPCFLCVVFFCWYFVLTLKISIRALLAFNSVCIALGQKQNQFWCLYISNTLPLFCRFLLSLTFFVLILKMSFHTLIALKKTQCPALSQKPRKISTLRPLIRFLYFSLFFSSSVDFFVLTQIRSIHILLALKNHLVSLCQNQKPIPMPLDFDYDARTLYVFNYEKDVFWCFCRLRTVQS